MNELYHLPTVGIKFSCFTKKKNKVFCFLIVALFSLINWKKKKEWLLRMVRITCPVYGEGGKSAGGDEQPFFWDNTNDVTPAVKSWCLKKTIKGER